MFKIPKLEDGIYEKCVQIDGFCCGCGNVFDHDKKAYCGIDEMPEELKTIECPGCGKIYHLNFGTEFFTAPGDGKYHMPMPSSIRRN